jgi:hypothetical protein
MIAVQLNLRVEHHIKSDQDYSLAIAQPKALEEIKQIVAANIPLILAGMASTQYPWPIDGRISEDMSQEAIVQVINNVLFREFRKNQYSRYSVELPILVMGANRCIQTTTVDLSQTGLYARSLNPHPQATEVRLHLVTGDNNPEITGVVVYTIGPEGDRIVQQGLHSAQVIAHPGMAIQFDSGQSEEIEQWLELARTAERQQQ